MILPRFCRCITAGARRAAAHIRPDEVHLDGADPRRHVGFLQGTYGPSHPRVIDQNVNGRKAFHRLAHQVLHLGWVGDIHWHDACRRPQNLCLLGCLLQVAAGAGCQDQAGPLLSVCQGDRPSNPTPGSGNERHSIVQLAHHVFSFPTLASSLARLPALLQHRRLDVEAIRPAL